MPTDVIMPQMGESIFEGTITKWLKKAGDPVEKDEPLFEISTDKVDAEIPSPVAGVLTEIKVEEGATVQDQYGGGGGERGWRGGSTGGSEREVWPSACGSNRSQFPPRPRPPQVAAKAAPAPPATAPCAALATGGTEVVMPQMGESIFEGTITKWLKKVRRCSSERRAAV